jgi:hypothetical protein
LKGGPNAHVNGYVVVLTLLENLIQKGIY